jgi:hypothetical protein
MKTNDNSAAAASDPKRRVDGLGSNAFDLATVHPHPKQPSSTSPPARPMVPRLGEIVMSRILAAQKPISESLRRQFVGGEPS